MSRIATVLPVSDYPKKIPVVVHLAPDEHAALMDFMSRISNDVTVSDVARYLIVDYMASELGFDVVPEMPTG